MSKKTDNTFEETTNALNNPSGTIFLVSTITDEGALTGVLGNLDADEAEEVKSPWKQADIFIKQGIHAKSVYSLDLNTHRLDIESLRRDIQWWQKKNEKTGGAKEYTKYIPTFYIALDEVHKKYDKQISTALKNDGYQTHIVNLNIGKCKTIADSHEQLGRTFADTVKRVYLDPDDLFQKYLDWITSDHHSDLSTGFKDLDLALGGGLSNDLYVLGAPSSIGKSTLALQIADYMAEHKHYVFYYSLEMDFKHIMSKSISRLAYQGSGPQYDKYSIAPTAVRLYQGKWNTAFVKKNSDFENLQNIMLASQRYGDIAKYLHLWNSNDRLPTAQDVYDDVANYVARSGESPVVIIDYLQLLRSPDDRQNQTDKQRVSEAIWKLKTISCDFDVPVIAISSFNRSSYTETTVDMSALKESGEIDYSAETIITLGYDLEHTRITNDSDAGSGWLSKTIAEWQEKEKKDRKEAIALWKKQPERAVKVNFLKNRYGAISNDIVLFTDARYDVFFNAKIDQNGILSADIKSFTDKTKIQSPKTKIVRGQAIYGDDVGISEQLFDLPF